MFKLLLALLLLWFLEKESVKSKPKASPQGESGALPEIEPPSATDTEHASDDFDGAALSDTAAESEVATSADATEPETSADLSGNGTGGTIHVTTRVESDAPMASAPIVPPEVEAEPPAQSPTHLPCALAFDGAHDYIEVPYAQILNPDQVTISCWAKITGGQGIHRSPITSRDDPPCRGYFIYAPPENRWQFTTGNGGWSSLFAQALTLHEWTHVAATYDGTTMKLYVNGSLGAESVEPYVPNRARPLRIGAGATEGNPQFFFNGQIAEVRVWNLVRSDAQIQADMNRRLNGAEDGLVGYWPLDEGEGEVAHDRTANANHGTIYSAAWNTDAGLALAPASTDNV